MIQQEMINKVRQLASETEDISAVLMYGSFMIGEGDEYSDIEFYIFLRDVNEFDKLQWVEKIAPVDLFFTNEFGTDVAVFSNLIRGEFHFQPLAEINVVRSWIGEITFEYPERMIQVDKDGKLAEMLECIPEMLRRPSHDSPEQKESLAYQLINNLIFEKNLLQRGEWAHAHQLFWFVQRYLLWFIRLHTGADNNHWLSPTKRLEQDIPAEWYALYKRCVPGLDEKELDICFREVLQLTGQLFAEMGIPEKIQQVLLKVTGDYTGCKVKEE